MFGIESYTAFLLAGIILNLTPGADTMYIIGRGISQGRRAGIYSALGIGTGSVIHTLFAAFGLSIILAKSALAFSIIKYVGAAYLVFLGIRMLVTKSKGELSYNLNGEGSGYMKIYYSAILTNVLNPKVALFYLAFLPQFINPHYANNIIPFLILGGTFITTGTVWCLVIATFSSKFAEKVKKSNKIKLWMDKFAGGIFIFLGISLALKSKQ
jgi:threonine/homoserine/homoserine lactone efflux protein